MRKTSKNIYLVQFGTGADINLLPLSAAQLVSRLKQEKEFLREYNLCEIISRRPNNPTKLASELKDVFIIGFSCFLWNINVSLETVREVRKKFPDVLIVLGGPSISKEPDMVEAFFKDNPAVDIICIGEGEEVFTSICKRHAKGKGFDDIPGIIYKDRVTGRLYNMGQEVLPDMKKLPSPYLDGTFDEFYKKYSSEFSGIIWETNRGCPFSCTFCTWGNLPSKRIREKPIEMVRDEVTWIGKHKIGYIAMSDSNFGISKRDVELAKMLAECKKKYGVPHFISVNWAKNSVDNILKIAGIFKKSGIGFRITLSLQSLNKEVQRAMNRINIKLSSYEKIRDAYRHKHSYSYTELIFGLPLETYESYMLGVEYSLSDSIFDQLFLYPLFLFPNTKIASTEYRRKYGIESNMIELRYPKSVELTEVKEFVEMGIGTSAMPRQRWLDSFVDGFYILALHNDRLAFFILMYLRKVYGVKITEIIPFMRKISRQRQLPTIRGSFRRLEDCASDIQDGGRSHLLEPETYGNIPYDSSDAVFLELLAERDNFYPEFFSTVEEFLRTQNIDYDRKKLQDLFLFQKAVMAHPDGPVAKNVDLDYDWVGYFAFTFQKDGKELKPFKKRFYAADPKPCNGDRTKFLKNHFNIRGVPSFNHIYDDEGKVVFPPVNLEMY